MKKLLCMVCVISSLISITALADGWNWVDPNQAGVSECYYFNDDGTYLTNTTTPDGYLVDANGAWVENGIVQTKTNASNTTVGSNTEIVHVEVDGKQYTFKTGLTQRDIEALQRYTDRYYPIQQMSNDLSNAAGDRPILHDPNLNSLRDRVLTDSEVNELVSKYGLWVQPSMGYGHEVVWDYFSGLTSFAIADYIDENNYLILAGDNVDPTGTYRRKLISPEAMEEHMRKQNLAGQVSVTLYGTDWLQS